MPGSDYYDHRTFPSHGAAGSSSGMRSELGDIEAGFDKLPDLLVANANLPVFVNALGTELEAISADSARSKLGTGTNLWCGTAGGTKNALALTPTPAVVAYVAGQRFLFKSGAAASDAPVIVAVSGLTSIAVQISGAALVSGEIAANSWYEVVVDASLTSCQLTKIGKPTFTELGISAFAQTILDDADAAAVRATLGTLAKAGDSWTGAQNEARATVASHATTADIWAAAGNSINWTGTATTTTFPAAPQAGAKRRLHCAGAASFTHSATLDILGNTNFTAVAGDIVDVEAITTTTFRLIPFKDDGTAIVGVVDATTAVKGKVQLLTSAELKTGTDTVKVPTAAAMLAAQGFTAYFASANQTITSAGALTIAHGLGRQPVLIFPVLKCLTAEQGYSIGDEIALLLQGFNVNNAGLTIVPDATNISIRFGSAASAMQAFNKTSGVAVNLTNTSWALIVRAWA